MEDYKNKKYQERPEFPKRAVITGGMPYGNKTQVELVSYARGILNFYKQLKVLYNLE